MISNGSIAATAIVHKANAVRSRITTDFATVWKIIVENDLVFAVWQDPTERDTVGTLIIKGKGRLEQIASSGQAEDLLWTAIPCISAEQAEALRIVCHERSQGMH